MAIRIRKVTLALALVMAVLVGGIGPVSVASASHNPTVGCWYAGEGTEWGNPSYGPHWEHHADGWWSYQWFEHWETCEDGSWDFLGYHQHWTYHGW